MRLEIKKRKHPVHGPSLRRTNSRHQDLYEAAHAQTRVQIRDAPRYSRINRRAQVRFSARAEPSGGRRSTGLTDSWEEGEVLRTRRVWCPSSTGPTATVGGEGPGARAEPHSMAATRR